MLLPRASIKLDLSSLAFESVISSHRSVLSVIPSGPLPQLVPRGTLVFELGRYVSCGRLWDVFEGTLHGGEIGESEDSSPYFISSSSSLPLSVSTGISVVLKLAVWDHHANYGFFPPEDHYAYTHEEKMEHAWNEATLYDGPLKPLQGSVVPRCYGAFEAEEGTGGTVFGIILEYLGKSPRQKYVSDLHSRHK